MSTDSLEVNVPRTGLLADGRHDTYFIAGTISLDHQHGIRVEVPYSENPQSVQFEAARVWFEKEDVPQNLALYTGDGPVTLFDCKWAGRRMRSGTVATGTFRVDEVLMAARDTDIAEPLLVTACRSRLDGLGAATSLSAAREDIEYDDSNRFTSWTIRLESPDPIEWNSGEATMRVVAGWRVDHRSSARRQVIDVDATLESEFANPTGFGKHYAEQAKVRSLLTLLFGHGMFFRDHTVQDHSITTKAENGRVIDHPYIELLSSRTLAQRARPKPAPEKLYRPLLTLDHIGPEGLQTWCERYDEWERFIAPIVAMISRRDRLLEESLLNAAMSLEAAGNLLGRQPDEKKLSLSRTEKPFYRCLAHLRVGWGGYIASDAGLARALANNYNTIKHANIGPFPNPAETMLTLRVAELVARLVAIDLTGAAAAAIDEYRKGNDLWQIQSAFDANGLRIADDGSWQSTR